MLVLYMLHTNETGVLRFNEIRHLMTDCSQKMLSLTETGRSLMPAIIALIDWGKEHFDEVVTD